MRFNVAMLAGAVDRAIADAKAGHERYEQKKANMRAAETAAWHDKYAEEWLTSFTKARAKLKKMGTLTDADFPQGSRYGHGYIAFFRDTVGSHNPYVVHSDLKVIKNVLAILLDEEVTDGQLARLGVRSGTLRTLAESIALESE